MNEIELQKIENELINSIDKETQTDNDIRTASEEIAAALVLSGSTQYSFNDIIYSFRYICNKANKQITIVAANVNKYKIAGNKYKPFIINASLDDRYTEVQSAIAAIEGFIRHITSNIKPEYLDDEE